MWRARGRTRFSGCAGAGPSSWHRWQDASTQSTGKEIISFALRTPRATKPARVQPPRCANAVRNVREATPPPYSATRPGLQLSTRTGKIYQGNPSVYLQVRPAAEPAAELLRALDDVGALVAVHEAAADGHVAVAVPDTGDLLLLGVGFLSRLGMRIKHARVARRFLKGREVDQSSAHSSDRRGRRTLWRSTSSLSW